MEFAETQCQRHGIMSVTNDCSNKKFYHLVADLDEKLDSVWVNEKSRGWIDKQELLLPGYTYRSLTFHSFSLGYIVGNK